MSKDENKYPEYILRCLRQRLGMEADDTSRDEVFQKWGPRRVLEEVLSWNGLIGGWSGEVLSWIKDIYGVDLERLKEE